MLPLPLLISISDGAGALGMGPVSHAVSQAGRVLTARAEWLGPGNHGSTPVRRTAYGEGPDGSLDSTDAARRGLVVAPLITLVLLGCFGLVAGIGITAVGPGGVLVTVGLLLCTGLSTPAVAGTAIVTNIATGSLGTFSYVRSGQLREPHTRRTALVLAGTAVVGTPVGVLINFTIPAGWFGILLALFVTFVAALVWHRQRAARLEDQQDPRHALPLLIGGGLVVAVVSGMFGLGGPLLTVPLLVAIGTPMLPALAAAQVQSMLIASVGSLGYLSQGSIDWPLAFVVGVPELVGVLIGWKIAHTVPTRHLTRAMIVALLAVAPFLAFHG